MFSESQINERTTNMEPKMSEEDYYREDWMTDDQWECAQMIADLCRGWHHICATIKQYGAGIRVALRANKMATFDYYDLTRAVIMAHDRCIRLQIAPSSPGRIGFQLWKRHSRDNSKSAFEYHPTIHEAVARWHDPNYSQRKI